MLTKLLNSLKQDRTETQPPSMKAPEIKGVIHKIRHKGDTDGLTVGIHIINGNLILDLGEAVQYVGMSPDEAMSFGAGLMAIASGAGEQPKAPLN
jgi:hypothetical protein